MKKYLLIFTILTLPIILMAQVPQGFTYQAVATDNNGLELVEQNISIRVSILSESSTGIEQWIETHLPITDGFGLFTITIGEGISTGGGAQSSFSNIDWGNSTHYLKIEMDIQGGSNYQLLGTSQLMSVPYALYAATSGSSGISGEEDSQGEEDTTVDYDSLINMMTTDSTFLTSISNLLNELDDDNSSSGSSVLSDINNVSSYGNFQTIYHDFLSGDFIVPQGKTLLINTITAYPSITSYVYVNGLASIKADNQPVYLTSSGNHPFVAGENDLISMEIGSLYGILIDKLISVVHYDFSNGDYVVPQDKKLVFYTTTAYPSITSYVYLNGLPLLRSDNEIDYISEYQANPWILDGGDVISTESGSFHGYLIDDYEISSEPIYGCLDYLSCNYDSNATDPGYCEYPELGFTCEGAIDTIYTVEQLFIFGLTFGDLISNGINPTSVDITSTTLLGCNTDGGVFDDCWDPYLVINSTLTGSNFFTSNYSNNDCNPPAVFSEDWTLSTSLFSEIIIDIYDFDDLDSNDYVESVSLNFWEEVLNYASLNNLNNLSQSPDYLEINDNDGTTCPTLQFNFTINW